MESITISKIQNWKKNQIKFAAITAYDFSFSRLFEKEGIPIMLVGDSLGMTIQGHNSTLPVKIQDIKYHTKAVRRGAPNSFLLSDLPFMSYYSIEETLKNTAKIIQSGANMIKIEGGKWLVETVKELSKRSILVCGHIGLTPQSINFLSGYKIQGKEKNDAQRIIDEAFILEEAGIKMLVLECIPSLLAKKITENLSIPVIGIGSGHHTDGQILVMQDLLGITDGKKLKFVKNFLCHNGSIQNAIKQYINEVKNGNFPSEKYSF
ncbi:3-methyl-2-oxobutanoate hydroxymethyltransferase [Buchnera aphidicola]|uniref:3-methyl-2-oxobutanoate hydroxymethyltransferase n=1 Tax=Buchnera aphidicola subsp. Schizaphis graminum (strain Sg) TaxID=198804 RepID=PANB_BUCAP|nr:3-methyl-2-oxobutanoate hydroxymethyltransferase [Buchnera aphidicola]Q8K9U6.1 RecName: Full=3-methyl-2-oxobutanoate hydroxymethyltransferase; AltName: Full=Ketopantoate hydroxymethyltransferase; Short=KPHMT [Buchnera aphidicola str. Sg (Schizaphis graminum)]AAM67756.1 3-methyl-2-oxobutanoate hydroxymethyltransferase [Buchnera aphidicola str. Sg (Schizaphis graminum)]AWI49746.1 3-methyl-2-oxobutanoate hydroxymethyltransferase [Buchnera aphidicola (Schizaphis graminum)]